MRARRKLEDERLSARQGECKELSAGFTLIELMIVITIIFILLGLAAGQYRLSVVRAREAALMDDLHVMREAIDNYTVDKQTAPQSVEDLRSAGYLRDVPIDPMTNTTDWQPKFDDFVLSPDQSSTGMTDVHSNSDKVSPFTQTAYNSW
jgi:general secretion pathway protein G